MTEVAVFTRADESESQVLALPASSGRSDIPDDWTTTSGMLVPALPTSQGKIVLFMHKYNSLLKKKFFS